MYPLRCTHLFPSERTQWRKLEIEFRRQHLFWVSCYIPLLMMICMAIFTFVIYVLFDYRVSILLLATHFEHKVHHEKIWNIMKYVWQWCWVALGKGGEQKTYPKRRTSVPLQFHSIVKLYTYKCWIHAYTLYMMVISFPPPDSIRHAWGFGGAVCGGGINEICLWTKSYFRIR